MLSKNILYRLSLIICLCSLIFLLFCNILLHKKLDILIDRTNQIEEQIDTIYFHSPLEKNVTLTVYNPVIEQCDADPLITANGTKIDLKKLKKGQIRYCAISRDLLKEIPYGSTIYIEGHGEYEVVDVMNKRFNNHVDILQDISEKIFKKENVKIIKIR